jgi:hypothetical protein
MVVSFSYEFKIQIPLTDRLIGNKKVDWKGYVLSDGNFDRTSTRRLIAVDFQ